ncbi:CLUMA_CG006396, isoform A [Clunio marinus]|uniref:CLUMA_CG006396, isoform A n=1 Tax=Clunio marinus TaxID=568069 RepID=A0A1J1HZ30_9DIPT|nr:CLUMA_CG006396, isoform A [Clunio marinus]
MALQLKHKHDSQETVCTPSVVQHHAKKGLIGFMSPKSRDFVIIVPISSYYAIALEALKLDSC